MVKTTSHYDDIAKMSLTAPNRNSSNKSPKLAIALNPKLVRTGFGLREDAKERLPVSILLAQFQELNPYLIIRRDNLGPHNLHPPTGLCPNYRIVVVSNKVNAGVFKNEIVQAHTAPANFANGGGLVIGIPAALLRSPDAKAKATARPRVKSQPPVVQEMSGLVGKLEGAIVEQDWESALTALAGILNSAHRNLGVSANTSDEGVVLEREVVRVARYTG